MNTWTLNLAAHATNDLRVYIHAHSENAPPWTEHLISDWIG
jgi:hypothetical protein